VPKNNNEIEKRLWDAADELCANSKLKSSEYSVPVLGLIFLRYADCKFTQSEQDLALVETQHAASPRSSFSPSRRGWDENGNPTLQTLRRLGIDLPEAINLIQRS